MNRVDSLRIAPFVQTVSPCRKGSALASDAFFPFREMSMSSKTGGIAIISRRVDQDDESIAAADEHVLSWYYRIRLSNTS